jgi:hypothetical protein
VRTLPTALRNNLVGLGYALTHEPALASNPTVVTVQSNLLAADECVIAENTLTLYHVIWIKQTAAEATRR